MLHRIDVYMHNFSQPYSWNSDKEMRSAANQPTVLAHLLMTVCFRDVSYSHLRLKTQKYA